VWPALEPRNSIETWVLSLVTTTGAPATKPAEALEAKPMRATAAMDAMLALSMVLSPLVCNV
jgi:hypothetical protein